jgi:hypothetical protein
LQYVSERIHILMVCTRLMSELLFLIIAGSK